jgi:hypothetical protein
MARMLTLQRLATRRVVSRCFGFRHLVLVISLTGAVASQESYTLNRIDPRVYFDSSLSENVLNKVI